MSVTLTLLPATGTPNLVFSISVIGSTIFVQPATNAGGFVITSWQAAFDALQANAPARAIASFETVGSNLLVGMIDGQSCTANPMCSITDETSSGIAVLVGSAPPLLTLTFKGMKVYSERAPFVTSIFEHRV